MLHDVLDELVTSPDRVAVGAAVSRIGRSSASHIQVMYPARRHTWTRTASNET